MTAILLLWYYVPVQGKYAWYCSHLFVLYLHVYISLSLPAPSHKREQQKRRVSCFMILRVPSCSWDAPRWRFPCLDRFLLVGSSINFIACFVIILFILRFWCLVCICVQAFALDCSMRRRGRVAFQCPLNFIFDAAGTILVQQHTRLCCVCTRSSRY